MEEKIIALFMGFILGLLLACALSYYNSPYEFFWKFRHPIRWFKGWNIRKSKTPDVFEVYWNE